MKKFSANECLQSNQIGFLNSFSIRRSYDRVIKLKKLIYYYA